MLVRPLSHVAYPEHHVGNSPAQILLASIISRGGTPLRWRPLGWACRGLETEATRSGSVLRVFGVRLFRRAGDDRSPSHLPVRAVTGIRADSVPERVPWFGVPPNPRRARGDESGGSPHDGWSAS